MSKQIKKIEKVGTNYPSKLYLWLPDSPIIGPNSDIYVGGSSLYTSKEDAITHAPSFDKFSLYEIPNPYPENIFLKITNSHDQ